MLDGEECLGWCQFGSPEELPQIKSRLRYEKDLGTLPDWRITCLFTGKGLRRRGVADAAPDRNRTDVRQMQRVTRETKGRYYEAHSARQLERALQAIQSRIRCDAGADDFQAELQAGGEEEIADTELDEGVHTADVTVSWRDAADDYETEEVDVIDADGDVVRRIDTGEVADSYTARGASAPVLGGRGRTVRALHIRNARAGTRLRIVVRADGRRTSGRVYARITQSRRRR